MDEEGEIAKKEAYEYFTLDVYSFIDVDLKELPMPLLDKTYRIDGEWKGKTG